MAYTAEQQKGWRKYKKEQAVRSERREYLKAYNVDYREEQWKEEVKSAIKKTKDKALVHQHIKDIRKVAKKFEVKEESPFLPNSMLIY